MRTFAKGCGWWMVWLMVALPVPAEERYGMDPATYDNWRRNHGRFARAVLADNAGGYFVLPMYDRRYPSSTAKTVSAARAELTRRVKESMYGSGSMVHTRIIQPPQAEAEALAMMLPALEVGQYGYIHSAEVVEVLGPDEMIVEDIWLIDERAMDEARRADERRAKDADNTREVIDAMYEQREALADRQDERDFRRATVRLKGFHTAGTMRGQRWLGPDEKGLQIAVVGKEAYGPERRPKFRLLAMPPDAFGEGVSETQFIELLEQRGLTPTQFVELIMEQHRATLDRAAADRAVFTRLLPQDPEEAE